MSFIHLAPTLALYYRISFNRLTAVINNKRFTIIMFLYLTSQVALFQARLQLTRFIVKSRLASKNEIRGHLQRLKRI